MKKEETFSNEIVSSIRRAWRHRKGVNLFGRQVIQDNTIPGLIFDTFENLGFITRADKLKPKLIKKRKTEYGWHLTFHLPPGISFQSVKRKVNYFSDAIKGFVYAIL